ncbi:MAG: SpoIIE family protein phosphatase [Chloroflexi bacterium]|jgi:serine/threonine protein phosphatase PrpC|nr:SpoIIE family protein phosphatase [Chloroflexota bacterium]
MIPAERAHVFVAAITHPGLSGKKNEDRFKVTAFHLDQERRIPSVLAVVADGIGGHRAGEVAAQIAVEAITQYISASSGTDPAKDINQAIIHASQLIFEQAERRNELKGMGATCACCWIIGDRLYTGSVGDTRIYLIRSAEIHQLSIDHTWIQEAIDHGALTPEEAQGHPNAHVIRRYLGSKQQVVPDLRLRMHPDDDDVKAEANQGVQLLPGDQLVLCSDGLTDLVSSEEILNALHHYSLDDALNRLVQLANDRGGHDNITVVALEVPESAAAQPVSMPVTPRRAGIACLGVGGLLLVGALVLGGIAFLLWSPRILGFILQPSATATNPPASPSVITQPALRTTTPFDPASPSPAVTGVTAAVPETRLPVSATPGTPRPAATLTPWPTNTPQPTPTPTITSIPSVTLTLTATGPILSE